MRRVAFLLASVAVAGAMAMTQSTSALAAQGTLTLVPQTYQNPSGCYNAVISPLIVINNTDQTATVHSSPDCSGDVVGEVAAGGASGTFEFGASVSIP
ncbi:hypothetical protein [Streptomyces sp. NPDC127098]|uniref:hypothetical protein n=1 Tax=Streptomyces sp. NPDC127098 TaxID=3347137 RepID=UPI003665323E